MTEMLPPTRLLRVARYEYRTSLLMDMGRPDEVDRNLWAMFTMTLSCSRDGVCPAWPRGRRATWCAPKRRRFVTDITALAIAQRARSAAMDSLSSSEVIGWVAQIGPIRDGGTAAWSSEDAHSCRIARALQPG